MKMPNQLKSAEILAMLESSCLLFGFDSGKSKIHERISELTKDLTVTSSHKHFGHEFVVNRRQTWLPIDATFDCEFVCELKTGLAPNPISDFRRDFVHDSKTNLGSFFAVDLGPNQCHISL